MKQFRLYKHIKKIISYCIIAFLLIGTVGCQKTNRFETSDEVDFYVLGSDGITGYQFNDEKLNEITKTDIKIINTNINPVVHRSELLNQYLVFTEEDFPGRDKQSLVSIDFNTGLIHRYQTDHCAYTSSGASHNYYFATTTGENSFISIYTPELEEVEYLKLEKDMLFSDFITSSDKVYTIGTEVEATKVENGKNYFKNILISISKNDGDFSIDTIKELEVNKEKQYFFNDVITKENYLYAVSAGWRDLDSLEKIYAGAIYRYDLVNETSEFYTIEEIFPSDIYDIGDDFLAISHESITIDKLGFTIFNYETLQSEFVDISPYAISENERIVDIKRLDLNHLLLLTENQLIVYDILKGTITLQLKCDDTLGTVFHIWIN